jgi:hypothetical protein
MLTPMRLGRFLPRWVKMPTRAVGASAGMAGGGRDLALRQLIEMEDDLDGRKIA